MIRLIAGVLLIAIRNSIALAQASPTIPLSDAGGNLVAVRSEFLALSWSDDFDLPTPASAALFDARVRETSVDDVLFVQGVGPRARRIAAWAVARAERGRSLTPRTRDAATGVWIYRATYEKLDDDPPVVPDPSGDTVVLLDTVVVVLGPASSRRTDTVVVLDSLIIIKIDTVFIGSIRPGDVLSSGGWQFGLGGGIGAVLPIWTGARFTTPMVWLFGRGPDRWSVVLSGGYWPFDARETLPDPSLPPEARVSLPPNTRATTVASLAATYYLTDGFPVDTSAPPEQRAGYGRERARLGMAFGVQGAWEFVRGSDRYVSRVYGVTVGPRVRVPWKRRWGIMAGADLLIGHRSNTVGANENPVVKLAPSIGLTYILGPGRGR